MTVVDRNFRLTNEKGGLGLSCSESGLALAGVPLLTKSLTGFTPRPEDEIAVLMSAAGLDVQKPQPFFNAVARALNRRDLAHAMTAAVLARIPELDWQTAARLAIFDERLRKYNPDQPRDWRGCWINGDDGADFSGQDLPPESPIDAQVDQNPNSKDELSRLQDKYDDLGPVELSKQIIQFGEQLARNGKNLAPSERAYALAEYAFLQNRVSFWLDRDFKPPEAQPNLISAAQSLYFGGVLSGLVPVGGNHTIPESMVHVLAGAAVLDDSQTGLPLRGRSVGAADEAETFPSIGEAPTGKVGEIIDNEAVGIQLDKGLRPQGIPWENHLNADNPDAILTPDGATGFDLFNPGNGEATSAKTLNTLSYGYADNPQSIYGTLKGYVDNVANYTPKRVGDIPVDQIKSRTIQLAVPEYTSPEQWSYINRAARYGESEGVPIVVTRVIFPYKNGDSAQSSENLGLGRARAKSPANNIAFPSSVPLSDKPR